MNCKPGERAFVIAGFPASNLGKVVRVLKLEGNLWEYEGHLDSMFPGARAWRVADDCLCPIRDPGDDAIDESKAWLPPVPTKEPA